MRFQSILLRFAIVLLPIGTVPKEFLLDRNDFVTPLENRSSINLTGPD